MLGDLFKSLVWDNLVKAALGRLFAAIPFLGWGPVGYVVTWIVVKYTDLFYEAMKELVDLQLIVFKNELAKKEYTIAAIHLRELAKTLGDQSDEFLKAREEAKLALSKFTRFDIAR